MRLLILTCVLFLTACGPRVSKYVPIPDDLLKGEATVCLPGYTASVLGACVMALRQNETVLLGQLSGIRDIEKARLK